MSKLHRSSAAKYAGLDSSSHNVYCTLSEAKYVEALKASIKREQDGKYVIIYFQDGSKLNIRTK